MSEIVLGLVSCALSALFKWAALAEVVTLESLDVDAEGVIAVVGNAFVAIGSAFLPLVGALYVLRVSLRWFGIWK